MTTTTKTNSFKEYLNDRRAKDLAFFYGDEITHVSNKYFRFNRVKDEDNVTILTNNIMYVKGNPVLVVGPREVVYLKDWQVRAVRNYDLGIETYAVKLNRNYFRVYTFRNDIESICVENEMNFDDFLNIAVEQTVENMKIAEGWGN